MVNRIIFGGNGFDGLVSGQYYISGNFPYARWKFYCNKIDNFPFPPGWDTIVSDITQLKEKINKVYDFIDSMIDDWAYHDYAYAYNASDSFSRKKTTELFKSCELFNNNPEYSLALNDIFNDNSFIINHFMQLKNRCINLKEECDKIINYVNVINDYISSAKNELIYIEDTQKINFQNSPIWDKLDKKDTNFPYDEFINWWHDHPFYCKKFIKETYKGLEKLELYQGSKG